LVQIHVYLYTKWQTKDSREKKELRDWFPRAWKRVFPQQQSSAGSTGQWKHPREEPLDVQIALFSNPGGKHNNSTNSPTTVNAIAFVRRNDSGTLDFPPSSMG